MNKDLAELLGMLFVVFIVLCSFAVGVGIIAVAIRWVLAG